MALTLRKKYKYRYYVNKLYFLFSSIENWFYQSFDLQNNILCGWYFDGILSYSVLYKDAEFWQPVAILLQIIPAGRRRFIYLIS